MHFDAMLTAITQQKPPCLVFRLGDKTFSVGYDRVVAIFVSADMNPFPDMPPFVRGAIDLNGAIVPVVDMRAWLDNEPSAITPQSRIVVIEVEGDDKNHSLGIIADVIISPEAWASV